MKHINDIDRNAEEIGMGGYLAPEKENNKYRDRMQKRKELQDLRVGKRNKEKGLIIVFTGNGKGKTTAALGMALRTLGHNHYVAIIQFIKGGWDPGERKALSSFKNLIEFHALGGGFTWESQDREKDKAMVKKAWEKSINYLANKKYKLVILDEINIAIKLGYITIEEVLDGLSIRPSLTHVALTGRSADQKLIEKADLVTEMNLIHHPFKEQGVKAQAGIEY